MDEETRKKIIPDCDHLLRGIPPDCWNFEEDRVSTRALNTDEMSVDWTKYRTPDQFLAMHSRKEKGHGLLRFKAELPRGLHLEVVYDPNPDYDPDNDAHTLIPGKKPKTFIKAAKKPEKVEVLLAAKQLAT